MPARQSMDSFGASFFPGSAPPASSLGTNIRDIASHCRALLRECSKLPNLKEDEWAENRLAEFNLWTANSGVFGGERASLDARLALQPEVIGVFISLLTVLNERLTQCQYFGAFDSLEAEACKCFADL